MKIIVNSQNILKTNHNFSLNIQFFFNHDLVSTVISSRIVISKHTHMSQRPQSCQGNCHLHKDDTFFLTIVTISFFYIFPWLTTAAVCIEIKTKHIIISKHHKLNTPYPRPPKKYQPLPIVFFFSLFVCSFRPFFLHLFAPFFYLIFSFIWEITKIYTGSCIVRFS